MDTILTIVLVFACIAMIALSAILLYDLTRDIMDERRAAERRAELFKKWSKMNLTNDTLYPDTCNHNSNDYRTIWYRMQFSCQYCDLRYLRACNYKEDERQPCRFECCPLLEDIENAN